MILFGILLGLFGLRYSRKLKQYKNGFHPFFFDHFALPWFLTVSMASCSTAWSPR